MQFVAKSSNYGDSCFFLVCTRHNWRHLGLTVHFDFVNNHNAFIAANTHKKRYYIAYLVQN